MAEILLEKKMELPLTSSWEDPYENFLHKVRIPIGNGFTSLVQFEKMNYGQCWTLQKETDAMWRIYSPTKQAVKIKTSLRKLGEASQSEPKYEPFSTRSRVIGMVEYLSKERVHKLISDFKKNGLPLPSDALGGLFIKRDEFSHEKEVRLIMVKSVKADKWSGLPIERKVIPIQIDPDTFIEEITLDPRIASSQVSVYKKIIQSLGYKGPVKRSNLYQQPIK